jgi:hypothetical protein
MTEKRSILSEVVSGAIILTTLILILVYLYQVVL